MQLLLLLAINEMEMKLHNSMQKQPSAKEFLLPPIVDAPSQTRRSFGMLPAIPMKEAIVEDNGKDNNNSATYTTELDF